MPGEGARIARHRHVEVEHPPAQQPVADRPADEPRGLAPQRLARNLERLAQDLPPVSAKRSRGSVRTTRAVSAHVTS